MYPSLGILERMKDSKGISIKENRA